MNSSNRFGRLLRAISLAGMLCWTCLDIVAAQAPPSPTPVRRQASIALVVGNTAYERQPLPNAAKDARDVAEKLRALGFSVLEQSNATRKGLDAAVTAFVSQLDDYDVAIFYYAGHGLQMDGNNYLVPVDAVNDQAIRESSTLFAVSTLISRMRGSNAQSTRTNLIILDACRDLRASRLLSDNQVGFARFQDTRGVFVAFSASYGQAAQDGLDGNSPYTKALVQHLGTPGLPLPELFQRVRTDVEQSTKRKQSPREENGLTGYASVMLVPPSGVSASTTRPIPPPARTPAPSPISKTGPNAALLSDIKDVPEDQRLAWLRERMAAFAVNLTARNAGDLLQEDLPAGTHRSALSLIIPALPDAVPAADAKVILEAIRDPLTRMNALMMLESAGKLPNRLTPDEYVTIVTTLSGLYRTTGASLLASRRSQTPAV